MIEMQIIWYEHVTQSNDMNEIKWKAFRKNRGFNDEMK